MQVLSAHGSMPAAAVDGAQWAPLVPALTDSSVGEALQAAAAPRDGRGPMLSPLLPPGPYLLHVEAAGCEPAVRSPQLEAGEVRRVELDLVAR